MRKIFTFAIPNIYILFIGIVLKIARFAFGGIIGDLIGVAGDVFLWVAVIKIIIAGFKWLKNRKRSTPIFRHIRSTIKLNKIVLFSLSVFLVVSLIGNYYLYQRNNLLQKDNQKVATERDQYKNDVKKWKDQAFAEELVIFGLRRQTGATLQDIQDTLDTIQSNQSSLNWQLQR